MKTKNKAKVNVFAALGWLVWKLVALLGSRFAKKKLDERRRAERLRGTALQRGLHTLTGHTRSRTRH